MSRQKRTKRSIEASWGAIIAVAVVIVVGVGYVISQQFAGDGTGLRNSDTAFNVPDYVGQPAPPFTATGADGHPYTFMPGDGRPTAIVFYMGYG